ncbi:hypothetical protein PV08_06035 [Exophiala spinifera]|uniref:Zn(2)-C6 fungal-type domain-containing protein n=1 Tax=Exophiala spinifera TaxID=91928 RepID=A0A0D2BXI3_9EURO|nr:uncharacterized protein PV08_06035 [Exophiala spinifera]KIW15984.1 hypothetical protein PV08_06035 [Exophiala spinifera]
MTDEDQESTPRRHESRLARRDASPIDSQSSRPRKQRRLATEERQRAVRACDGCRKVKEKCEGGVPCRRCSHFGRPCEFKVLPSKVPGIVSQQGSLEAPEVPIDEVLERSRYLERILRHKLPQFDLSTRNLRDEAQALDPMSVSRTACADQPTGQDEGDLEIEDERATLDPITENVAHYSGEFSYWNFSMRIKKHVNALMLTSDDQTSADPPYHSREALLSEARNLLETLSCVPPRQIAEFLVHVFFKHAAINFFYVDRSWLNDKISQVYDRPSTLTSRDGATASIVLMIFAVGSQYAHLESVDRQGSAKDSCDHEAGNMFYQHALKLLPDIIHLGSLESVQACLLFGLYALPLDASGLAYVYLNMAIKLAMQNGMHRNIPGNTFSATIKETRNRVWWTAYCTEKKIGIFHGRPLSVLPSDIDAALPRDDRADMSRIPHMLVSIRLMDRLGALSNEIMLLRNCQKHEVSGILNRLVAMKDDLRSWWESLPTGPAGQKVSPQSPHFRPNTHLQLEYCLLRMFAGRPFLLTLTTANPSPPSTTESHSTPHATRSSTGKALPSSNSKGSSRTSILVDDCAQAAKEAIDICVYLRSTGAGLARASYVEYSSCRASLLVLIAYCIQNQTDEFYDTLGKGLDIIREMSTVGESAKSEVFLIESLEQALKRLHFFREKSNPNKHQSPLNPASGYENFRQWTRNSTTKDNSDIATQDPSPPSQDHQGPGKSSPYANAMLPSSRLSHISNDLWQESHPFSSNDAELHGLNNLQSAAGSAFFAMENYAPALDGFVHPESQLLENFLAIPDYEFPFQTE